jgi:hypothetical protein
VIHVEQGSCPFVEGPYYCDDQAGHSGGHWRSTVFPVQQDGSKREPLPNAKKIW